MFRLHRNKPTRSKERFHFKFSQFKAVQVPKGWDKLFVSIVCLENGKAIAKSGKALVRNGSCQWTETLSESIWVSAHDESYGEMEDCLFKFVVATGSARSGILGEATVNMTSYMSSSSPVPVSFPLKKCNHGTTLQVKIHCLTLRAIRDEQSNQKIACNEDSNADSSGMDINSDGSVSIFAKSLGSSSSKDLDSTVHRGESGSGETRFGASDSHHNHGQSDGLEGKEDFSPGNNFNDDKQKQIGRQDSNSSGNSVTQGHNYVDYHSQSSHSSFNSRITYSEDHSENNQQELTTLLRTSGSSKSFLEAAEDTINELREEAKMWERDARKVMVELDILKKELADQSKNQANLDIELSAANAERDVLKKEVEQLKFLVEASKERKAVLEDSMIDGERSMHIRNELENEIKIHKEHNANLASQLKRSQEANIELVSVLQELEETIEKQRIEIHNLLGLQSKFSNTEDFIQEKEEERKNLVLQLQQSQQSEKTLQAQVQFLEQALDEQNKTMHSVGRLSKLGLLNTYTETEYKLALSAKEEEIFSLKAKLSKFVKDDEETSSAEIESENTGDASLIGEIESLKTKLQELERDCNELTDENLELLFKLKEKTASSHNEKESSMNDMEEKMKKKILKDVQDDYNFSIQELESLKMELEAEVKKLNKELVQKMAEIEKLEDKLLSKEEENVGVRQSECQLEAKFSNLLKEKAVLEGKMEIVQRESDIATKCLNDLRKDLSALSSRMDSYMSANKSLERKSSELESEKHELELQLSELEHENKQLSLCISDLETQLRDLTDDRNSSQLELENSKSLAQDLRDEIKRLTTELETEKIHAKGQLQNIHDQFSKIQGECEFLRRENLRLQETEENLLRAKNSLQKSNEELSKEQLELQKSCANLEARLRESNKSLADCFKRVEILEENLSSVLEDFALKEESLTSKLDVLLDENRKHKEKIMLGESLLNKIYSEKAAEVEDLQREIESLNNKLSAMQDEMENIASNAQQEASELLYDKAKLETVLQEVQSKLKWTENELSTVKKEADRQVHSQLEELDSLKKKQEMLEADQERMVKVLADYKSIEEKFKNNVSDLELRLTVSEYEKQQLIEESTNLKVQLLKVNHIEDEVLTLRNELNAVKSEKETLEVSLHQKSNECEDLKAVKISLTEKISALQKAASELADSERTRQKTRVEGNRKAKEAALAQDDELRNELGQSRRTNRKLQRKIQLLEDAKEENLKKTQALQEELKSMKNEKQSHRESNEINSFENNHEREIDNEVDPFSKIQFLENELAKVVEANNTCKIQLNRVLSESQNNHRSIAVNSALEDVVTKEKYERTKSMLEAELRDLRDRYLHMSVKFAEVETEREELFMKLKGAKNGRRWFS